MRKMIVAAIAGLVLVTSASDSRVLRAQSTRTGSLREDCKLIMLCQAKSYKVTSRAWSNISVIGYSVTYDQPVMLQGEYDGASPITVYRKGSVAKIKPDNSVSVYLPETDAKNSGPVNTDKAAVIYERIKKPILPRVQVDRVFEIILLDEDLETIKERGSVKLPSGEVLKVK